MNISKNHIKGDNIYQIQQYLRIYQHLFICNIEKYITIIKLNQQCLTLLKNI